MIIIKKKSSTSIEENIYSHTNVFENSSLPPKKKNKIKIYINILKFSKVFSKIDN